MVDLAKIERAEALGRALVTEVHGRVAIILPIAAACGSDADAERQAEWIARVVEALDAAGIGADT